MFLFLNSCVLFVKKPEERYTLAIAWNDEINLIQNKSGICFGGYAGGDPNFLTHTGQLSNYKQICWQALEEEIVKHGNFRIVHDESADIIVKVDRYDLQETINIESPTESNQCYYLHDIYADISISIYKKGVKLDEVSGSSNNSQDLKSNSNNTNYKVTHVLIDAENIMKRASNHGAYAVINKVSKAERKAKKSTMQ